MDSFVELLKKSDPNLKINVAGETDPPPTDPPPTDPPPTDPPPTDPISLSMEDLSDWGFDDTVKTKDDVISRMKSTREEHTTLKSAFKSASEKYNETTFNSQKAEFDKLKKQNNDLMGAIDPVSHFSSPESFKREQLIKKFPGKSPSAISKIMGEDLSKMEPLNLLRLQVQFKYGWDDKSKIDSLLEDEYDVDLKDTDFTLTPKMEARGVDALEELSVVKNTEIDEPTDYKTQMENTIKEHDTKVKASKEAWVPITEKALKNLDKLSFELPDRNGKNFKYEFDIDPKQLEGVAEFMANQLSLDGGEVSQEKLKKAMDNIYWELVKANFSQIFANASGTQLAKLDQEWSDHTNNTRRLNTKVRQPKDKTSQQLSKEQAEDKIMKM